MTRKTQGHLRQKARGVVWAGECTISQFGENKEATQGGKAKTVYLTAFMG